MGLSNTVKSIFIITCLCMSVIYVVLHQPVIAVSIAFILMGVFLWPIMLISYLFPLQIFMTEKIIWVATAVIMFCVYYKLIEELKRRIRIKNGDCGGYSYSSDCTRCKSQGCNRRRDINKKLPHGGFANDSVKSIKK